jgi:hypothetical protein
MIEVREDAASYGPKSSMVLCEARRIEETKSRG